MEFGLCIAEKTIKSKLVQMMEGARGNWNSSVPGKSWAAQVVESEEGARGF